MRRFLRVLFIPFTVPARSIEQNDGHVRLSWHFDSLESGVPVGLLLPSEISFDSVFTTMARRAWAPFVVLFAITVMLARWRAQGIAHQDVYFLAAIYSFRLHVDQRHLVANRRNAKSRIRVRHTGPWKSPALSPVPRAPFDTVLDAAIRGIARRALFLRGWWVIGNLLGERCA